MALVTLSDVKAEAATPRRSLDITSYNDAILTKEIAKAQSKIEKQTGRVFTEKEFTQSEINFYSSMIFLRKSPITSITEFKINNSDVEESEYQLNPETGIIEFNIAKEFDYTITYKACEDISSDAYLIAQEICMDLVFMNLQKPSDGKDIKSYKDGNFSVTYEENDPQIEIDKKIKILEKPVMDVIGV